MTHAQMMKLILEIYNKKQTREGQHVVEQLLAQTPKDYFLWEALGVFLSSEQHFHAAIAAYRKALEIAPPSLNIYSNMGNSFKKLNMNEEAIFYHKLAIQQKPNDSVNWLNYGISLREANQKKEAIDAFTKAIQYDGSNYLALFNLGIIHLYFGEYELGWKLFENRMLAYPKDFINRPRFPVWNNESLDGKKLLILNEQGFGDNIMFSRFIKDLKKKYDVKIVLLTPAPLVRLFNKISGVDNVMSSPALTATVPQCDYYLEIMSLPNRLQIYSEKKIPPPTDFDVLPECQEKINTLIKPYEKSFKIGIVWSGSTTNQVNRMRSIPLEFFLKLFEVPKLELFSFQKGGSEQNISQLGLTAIVHNLGIHFEDFADTAAAVNAMDMFIMIDSSVAHLAGSFGKPTWLLLHNDPYWLWGYDRINSPWYPSIQLYRQKESGNWEPVIKEVVKDLAKKIEKEKS